MGGSQGRFHKGSDAQILKTSLIASQPKERSHFHISATTVLIKPPFIETIEEGRGKVVKDTAMKDIGSVFVLAVLTYCCVASGRVSSYRQECCYQRI